MTSDADVTRWTIRAAYLRGFREAQRRAADGVRRWWSGAPAGHRHPGNPHHLETKIRAMVPAEWETLPDGGRSAEPAVDQ